MERDDTLPLTQGDPSPAEPRPPFYKKNGSGIYTVHLRTPDMFPSTEVQGSVGFESKSLRKRFNIAGGPTQEEGGSQQENQGERKNPNRSWGQMEKDITKWMIRCIVWMIPRKYNKPSMEMAGMTPWEHRLRVQWLDRGLYKRKIFGAVFILGIVLVLFFASGFVPWRALFQMDSVTVYTDSRGIQVHNMLIPRMIDPKGDASDASKAEWILRGDPLDYLSREQVKSGYVTVRTGEKTKFNVSRSLLHENLNETAFGNFRCLCAVHMGVPVNAILYSPDPGRMQQLRDNPNAKANPTDHVFMLEPLPTGGMAPMVTSGPMVSNLDPDVPFTVTHPSRLSIKFFTMEGLDDRVELRGDDAACAIRCISISWKEEIAGDDAILIERPHRVNRKGGGTINQRVYSALA